MGFLKDGSFATPFIDKNSVEETEVLMDSRTNKPTGYVQNVSYNIVDVGRMAADPAYLADIKSQYESVFLDPKTDYSLKQQYLTDIGYSAHTWEELSDMDPGFAEREVKDAMIEHQWEGYFPKQFGEKVALTQIELKKGSALLTQAEQFNNPIGGQPYVAGDTVYVTRAAKERYEDPNPKIDDINNPTYVRLRILNNKINEAASDDDVLNLFNTVQKTPGGESFLKKIGGKVVEVKKDTTTNEWIEVGDALQYGVDDLKTIYQGYK